MAVGGNGIQVPVSLQVDASEFQSIIDKLKQSVNKLAPDSKLYSGLTKDLQKVEKEADAIRAALAQGFSNPTQLERFNQKVASFGEHIRVAAQQLTRAHFEDLNLNLVKPEDLQKLDRLKEAVDIVQQRVDNFQTDQMREIVKQSQAMQEAFSTLKLDVDTSDYTQAMKKANDQIDKLRENAAKKQAQTNAKSAALQKAEKAKELRGDLFDIMHQGHQANYTEFFKSNNAWKSQDKKNEFVQLLEEIGIGPKTLQEISNSTGNQIRDFWDRINNEIKAKGLDLKLDNKIKDLQDQLNVATEEENRANLDLTNVERLRVALQELNNLDPTSGTEFAQKYQQVQEALQTVIAEYENYKKQILEATQLNEDASDSNQRMAKTQGEVGEKTAQVAQSLHDSAAASREMEASQQQLTNAIKRWFSFREVINLTKRAIKDAVNHIKELDATMTQIAVVTNMTQADLWNQISTYSAIAQQYGVTTNGVYQVSQLYYQQGLQTADVMKLTTETLKMAKIANLDYATSTDYMTVAIRGFKMEMDDAQRVTDVYSRLAAVSASNTEELAVAMSKTASSAEAVGSSFENTSAMIALMIETTR